MVTVANLGNFWLLKQREYIYALCVTLVGVALENYFWSYGKIPGKAMDSDTANTNSAFIDSVARPINLWSIFQQYN